ncbi:hypothetical protein Esti_002624 [Eimeria stiedai]
MAAAPTRTAAEFLTQYLALSGFDGENGPFMVCKELLDNAVDACAKSGKPRFPAVQPESVQLELQLNENKRRLGFRLGRCLLFIEIQRLTNGRRVRNRTESSKGNHFMQIMLYSQRDMKEPINVTLSLTLSENSVAPAIQNFKGLLLVECKFQMTRAFACSRKHLFFFVAMDDGILHQSTQLCPLWDSLQEARVESYAAAHAVWSERVGITTILAFHPQRTHQSPRGTKGTFLRFPPPQETHAVATASAVCDEIKIALTAAVVSTESSEINADIFLLRSFNGMPLLSEDASACLITKSLRLFLAQNGQYFGLEALASDASKVEPLDCNRSVWSCLTQVGRDLRKVQTCTKNTALQAVNVTSEKALFGTLSKSFLNGSYEVTATLTSAFHRLFNHLRKALPSGFRSVADATRNKAANVFAPNMAASVAGIICTSSNPKFQAAALELLGLEHLKLQPDPLPRKHAFTSLETIRPSKRARTRAINEIIQDSVLERIL